MIEQNKLFNQITWIFEASFEQIRFVVNDTKRIMNYPQFQNAHYLGRFYKNIIMSSTLLKQARGAWSNMLKSGNINGKIISNIFQVYINRSTYTQRVGLENLSQISYDEYLKNDPAYQNLYKKTFNLNHLMNDLTKNFQMAIEVFNRG